MRAFLLHLSRYGFVVWLVCTIWITTAQAAERTIHLSIKTEITSEKQGDSFLRVLKRTLDRRDDGAYEFVWRPDENTDSCEETKIIITRSRDAISVQLFKGKQGLVLNCDLAVNRGDSDFDIAQALAMKILFIAGKNSSSEAEVSQQTKPPPPIPKPNQEEELSGTNESSLTPASDNATESQTTSPEEEKENTPPEPVIPLEPNENAPLPEQQSESAEQDQMTHAIEITIQEENDPPSLEPGFLHLEVNPSFLTGFTSGFNTGGLELGLTFMVYRNIALRGDLGFYPYSSNTKNRNDIDDINTVSVPTKNEFMVLPINISAGYRRELGNWTLGGYGGLFMMQVWSWHENHYTSRKASNFVAGVSLLLEAGYRFNDLFSLGLFLRPTCVVNRFEEYMLNASQLIYPDIETELIDSEVTAPPTNLIGKVFELPRFQMMTGLSLTFSF